MKELNVLKICNPIKSVRDAGVKKAINFAMGDIGQVSELTIDAAKKVIVGNVILNGESNSIAFTINDWEFSDGGDELKILGVQTDRQWLTAIANRAIVDKWFAVPAGHMQVIKAVLLV